MILYRGAAHLELSSTVGYAVALKGNIGRPPAGLALAHIQLCRRLLREADELIQKAVEMTIQTYRTADIMAKDKTDVGCQRMGEEVLKSLEQI